MVLDEEDADSSVPTRKILGDRSWRCRWQGKRVRGGRRVQLAVVGSRPFITSLGVDSVDIAL